MKSVVVCITTAVAAACSSNVAPIADAPPYSQEQVERGRYLVTTVAFCDFCHTPMYSDGTRDLTRRMAGRDCVIDRGKPNPNGQGTLPPDKNDGYGCLSFANATNHENGIGLRTDEEVMAAVFRGKRFDGTNVASVHPYYMYATFTAEDQRAVVAFLRSLPHSDLVTRREPPWDMEPEIAPVALENLPAPGPAATNLESASRGKYLASIAACAWCHTATYPASDPKAATDIVKRDQFFQGGRSIRARSQLGYEPGSILLVPPVAASAWGSAAVSSTNITPDRDTGIGHYSLTDFIRVMREGKDIENKYICAAAHGDATGISAALTDADLEDLYNYFMASPGVARPEANTCEALR